MSLDMSDPATKNADKNAEDLRFVDRDTGISWIKNYGKGRIFYGSLGHNHQTTWNPTILKHYLDGIQFALGDLPVDATPKSKRKTLSSKSSDSQESWKKQTVLISPQGDQTVVRSYDGNKTLFKNADPQLAIEWGMANARTTVVLAGKYVVSETIDIPRDNVTLIIDQGAEISLNPDTEHTTDIGFRSFGIPGYWHTVPLIYNRGKDNFRVINFGALVYSDWRQEKHGKMTFPIVFDGRKDDLTCGIEGGFLLSTGSTKNPHFLIDSRWVQIPISALDWGTDAVLVLEGCESCDIGMLVNLPDEPDGATGETLDLNSRCRGITIELVFGQRPKEIIDFNESHADVGEIVSIGEPRKLFGHTHSMSGQRFTSRPSFQSGALNLQKKTILTDATHGVLKHELPKLPDALPRFTVKTTVEVMFKDGSKKEYTKEVEIDIRKF